MKWDVKKSGRKEIEKGVRMNHVLVAKLKKIARLAKAASIQVSRLNVFKGEINIVTLNRRT